MVRGLHKKGTTWWEDYTKKDYMERELYDKRITWQKNYIKRKLINEGNISWGN